MSDATFTFMELNHDGAAPSEGFGDWVTSVDVSLLVSHTTSVFVVGRHADGTLDLRSDHLPDVGGICADGTERLWLAAGFQLWRYENAVVPGTRSGSGHDRLFLPRTAHTVGTIGVTDVAVDGAGRPVFVNTAHSCLAGISERLHFEPRWAPPFVTKLTPTVRCFLSGLAMSHGVPAVVTAHSTDDAPAHREAVGVVLDVASNEVMTTGLYHPFAPRFDDAGRLWVTCAGTGEVGVVDRSTGRFEAVARVDAYARSLALVGRWAVVGASGARERDSFDHYPCGHRAKEQGRRPFHGLLVIDTETGSVEHHLELQGNQREVMGIVALPGVRRPVLARPDSDRAHRSITIGRHDLGVPDGVPAGV